MAEFECPNCQEDFEAEWNFGDTVVCPSCKKVWETDYDEDWDLNVSGPWIEREYVEREKLRRKGG